MLDQLELMDELSQIGFIGRNSVTFKDGEKVVSRGWQIMLDRMQDTFFDFCLNIRQKCSEAVFRASYASLGGEVHAGWLLEQFEVDESSASPYKVTSTILEVGVGNRKVVKRCVHHLFVSYTFPAGLTRIPANLSLVRMVPIQQFVGLQRSLSPARALLCIGAALTVF